MMSYCGNWRGLQGMREREYVRLIPDVEMLSLQSLLRRIQKARGWQFRDDAARDQAWARVLATAQSAAGGAWPLDFTPNDVTPEQLQALCDAVEAEFLGGLLAEQVRSCWLYAVQSRWVVVERVVAGSGRGKERGRQGLSGRRGEVAMTVEPALPHEWVARGGGGNGRRNNANNTRTPLPAAPLPSPPPPIHTIPWMATPPPHTHTCTHTLPLCFPSTHTLSLTHTCKAPTLSPCAFLPQVRRAGRPRIRVVLGVDPRDPYSWLSGLHEDNTIFVNSNRWREEVSQDNPLVFEGALCRSKLEALAHTLGHELVRGGRGAGPRVRVMVRGLGKLGEGRHWMGVEGFGR